MRNLKKIKIFRYKCLLYNIQHIFTMKAHFVWALVFIDAP